MAFFLRPFFYFLFPPLLLVSLSPSVLSVFVPSLLHARGWSALALVVIGRGQITTPYILVIPSEGDYPQAELVPIFCCFFGSCFDPSQSSHPPHNIASLFGLS